MLLTLNATYPTVYYPQRKKEDFDILFESRAEGMYLSLKYVFPCLFTMYIWALQPHPLPLLLGSDKVYVMAASLCV